MTARPPTVEELLPTLNRALPASDEAERGLLSYAMHHPEWLAKSLGRVHSGLFYHAQSRAIFETMADELGCGRGIQPNLLTHRLRESGKLDNAGGPGELSLIFGLMPTNAMARYYLEIANEAHVARQNIYAHARALDSLFSVSTGTGAVSDRLEEIKGYLEDASRMPGKLLKSKTLKESAGEVFAKIHERLANPGKLPGFTTGLPTLDRRTGGLQPCHVWVFGGEPGDGKSTIMQNCVEAAAEAGAKVRWYPLEMPTSEQTFRILCSQARLGNDDLYWGMLSPAQQQALQNAMGRMERLGIELVEVEDATATDILADIERSDCDIAVVDYLQLMEDGGTRKSDTRETILASISRRQKRLARRSGKCIVTASQLNDYGKLRESRAIGQDADKVMLVQKVEDKDSDTGFDDARRRLLADKNRGGQRHWALPLRFLGSIFQFREEVE